mgnify:CR=1 FL=1
MQLFENLEKQDNRNFKLVTIIFADDLVLLDTWEGYLATLQSTFGRSEIA